MMRTMTAALASFVLLCSAPARADTVHDALEAYALYQNDVSTLMDLDVDSPQAVETALARMSRHNPLRVSRGWIAYGALTAAQSPAFAAGVEARVRANGEAPVVRQLRSDVMYARRQPAGANQAIRLILSTASADGARAAQAGARYDSIARSNASWLRSPVRGGRRDRSGTRLPPNMREQLQVGALAAQPNRDADDFGGRRFWDALAGRDGRSPRGRGSRERNDYSSVTDHMLTVGALVVVGAADSERSRVAALLNEPLTQACLHMQQLQLRQCASVAHDTSERAYCLGRHGLTGPGGCFASMVR